MKISVALIACLLTTVSFAQNPSTAKVSAVVKANSNSIVDEYVKLLSIPNVSKDSANIMKNAAFIMEMMNARGIQKVQLLRGNSGMGSPAIYGEALVPGATQTLIFYAHYDGQPVNPDQWTDGLKAFEPRLYDAALYNNGKPIPFPTSGNTYNPEWRIYARSAADDKGGVMAILTAYDALRKSGQKHPSNIKFFFDGEEEIGSPHLSEILVKNSSLLQSDLWIICDGPVHQSGKKQIALGVRGDTHLDLTVYGPKRPLHSGHYGNWAPNPALMLTQLLASMKDENGLVTIKGFYDDVVPLSASEKKVLSEVPSADDQMKRELGINQEEMQDRSLVESINQPSLNINGIQSGNVGKMASNQIPTYATAVLDLRLVLGNDWDRQQQKVIEHIKTRGYHVIDREPTDEERMKYPKIIKVLPGDGYNAQRISMDIPIVQQVIEAVKATTTDQVVMQPTMGGSLPLYVFEKFLQAKTISIPIGNHDNNQHAENENMRLKNLFDGIETMASLMMIKPAGETRVNNRR